MNVAAITAKTHRLTKTDNTTYTDANILIDLNQIDKEMGIYVLKVQGYREALGNQTTTDLISVTGLAAGQLGYNGEYPFPDDFLRLKRLEVNFDDETSVPTVLYDSSTNVYSEYVDSGDPYTEDEPHVKFDRGSYFIRPLPTTTVTNGIYIEYEYRQPDLTTGSPFLPEDFHAIYPLLLSKEYAKENPEKYNRLWDEDIARLKREIATYYRRKFNYVKQITPQRISFA